jgi:ADP-dependent NAD(P)H-hydrate dehydratase / NAD(P)H-hydrate epimerase
MDIVSVAEMREIERVANENGLPYTQMMENAGIAAAEIIFDRLSKLPNFNPEDASDHRVVVLCGPGSNGGDGLVCARMLARLGVTTQVFLSRWRGRRDPLMAELIDAGAYVDGIDGAGQGRLQRLGDLWSLLIRADIVVDALLGTGKSGRSRAIDGDIRDILNDLAHVRNTLRHDKLPYIVALDGPSGMDFDTGQIDPATVPADLTITFHTPKRGHYCFPAAHVIGELQVPVIGISNPPSAQTQLCDDTFVGTRLPTRKRDAHKNTHGKPLVLGGCADYVGAPTLSALASYRVGAGIVALAVPHAVRLTAATAVREAIFVNLNESEDVFAAQSLPHLEVWLNTNPNSPMLIGPGLGTADTTLRFLDGLLDIVRTTGRKNVICDADGLNLLSKKPDWHTLLPAGTILTPHVGEMARLTGRSSAQVQEDRVGLALYCARTWGHVVVLKGAYTVVASPDDKAVVMPFANPALSTAGTGDVLAGCILGLLAQGLSPFDAAACGAYLHGKAGERWRDAFGEAGMLASDLLPLIPTAIRDLKI